jgi:hypothetical protein
VFPLLIGARRSRPSKNLMRLESDGRCRVYTPALALKNAAFVAFIGMTLLTVVCALGFISDVSALLAGAIAPMMVAKSAIHLLASLSVEVFLYVFQRAQS